MYLDDCIVHAKGDVQFLERLESVLSRFQKHKMQFRNGTRCGKEISQEGLTMSKKKIASVLAFPRPTTAAHMKQFVGLANYFHDYVPHHAVILKPLHDMISNYQKKTRAKLLLWTVEGTKVFNDIIAEISKGHTMYFPREDCPIFVRWRTMLNSL